MIFSNKFKTVKLLYGGKCYFKLQDHYVLCILTQHEESPASRGSGHSQRLIQSHNALSYIGKTNMTLEQKDILCSLHERWLVCSTDLCSSSPCSVEGTVRHASLWLWSSRNVSPPFRYPRISTRDTRYVLYWKRHFRKSMKKATCGYNWYVNKNNYFNIVTEAHLL